MILAAKTRIEIGPIRTVGAPVVLLFLSLLVQCVLLFANHLANMPSPTRPSQFYSRDKAPKPLSSSDQAVMRNSNRQGIKLSSKHGLNEC